MPAAHLSDPSSLPCPHVAECSMAIRLRTDNHGPADHAAVRSQHMTLRNKASAQRSQCASARSPAVQQVLSASDDIESSKPLPSAGPVPTVVLNVIDINTHTHYIHAHRRLLIVHVADQLLEVSIFMADLESRRGRLYLLSSYPRNHQAELSSNAVLPPAAVVSTQTWRS